MEIWLWEVRGWGGIDRFMGYGKGKVRPSLEHPIYVTKPDEWGVRLILENTYLKRVRDDVA